MPIRAERPTEVVFAGMKMPLLSDQGQQAAHKLDFRVGTPTFGWPKEFVQ
uniref:Uncharacterized protein n=1 Tax=Yersinia enterocolitica W22703 TaxID=913028 RepID=F4N0U3_YEREN|nr:unknown protein [Yersinia enterocolitica W22703]